MSKFNTDKIFGLIGRSLTHSFSGNYFTQKFERENIKNCIYKLFELSEIDAFKALLEEEKNLVGLNVTIPYKESIIKFLDELDETAASIKVVNTIKYSSGKLKGFNTDVYGFRQAIKPLLKLNHRKALILGTGGASKAIRFVLDEMQIESLFVSRNPQNSNSNTISYDELNENALRFFPFIINTTPLGTYPNVESFPPIPYEYLNENNFLFDLTYNPQETAFLKKGKAQGALIENGLKMLKFQAEKSWEIWNNNQDSL